MDEHFAPSVHGVMPWNVAHENMYDTHNMRGAPPTYAQVHFPAPVHTNESVAQWKAHREQTLREWGQKRESQMHRMPSCLMDQMMSGSGLFPIRHIDEQEWLTPEEIGMVTSLEAVLQRTGHGRNLALDMLTPRIYNLNVKIILDNSGSMGLDMMGEQTNTGPTNTWIDKTCSYISVTNQNGNPNRYYDIDQAFAAMFDASQPQCNCCCRMFAGCCGANGPCPPLPVPQRIQGGIDPRHRRWFFARDHLAKWLTVYRTMGIEPPVYLLNNMGPHRARGPNNSIKVTNTDVNELFSHNPSGGTPLTEVIASALADHKAEAPDQGLFLLILTDGEATNMDSFNTLLDSIQWGAHGDVQVCLNGLSLVPEDLEWFENEECDDTRIRTVEAFEVEQQQMLRKEVIGTEGDYNFDMHVFRTLVTNFYPADYDVEAPMQNIRHRLYATCHGRDRWWMQSCCACYGTYKDITTERQPWGKTFGCNGGPCGLYCCCSKLTGVFCCTPLYLGTCFCCFGCLQGQECCKCRPTECCEACTCGGGE